MLTIDDIASKTRNSCNKQQTEAHEIIDICHILEQHHICYSLDHRLTNNKTMLRYHQLHNGTFTLAH